MAVAKYRQYLEQVRRWIEQEHLTQNDVAQRLQIDRTTVQRWCYRFGIQTQRTGPRRGERHPDWKGGYRKIGRYWYRYAPHHPSATKARYVAEHRLVMEATLQRYLLPKEVVHHRNGDPEDNRPENLAVFQTNADHLRQELTGKVPRWTPEGWRRMQAAGRTTATRRRLKSGDRPHTQTSDHPA